MSTGASSDSSSQLTSAMAAHEATRIWLGVKVMNRCVGGERSGCRGKPLKSGANSSPPPRVDPQPTAKPRCPTLVEAAPSTFSPSQRPAPPPAHAPHDLQQHSPFLQ